MSAEYHVLVAMSHMMLTVTSSTPDSSLIGETTIHPDFSVPGMEC